MHGNVLHFADQASQQPPGSYPLLYSPHFGQYGVQESDVVVEKLTFAQFQIKPILMQPEQCC